MFDQLVKRSNAVWIYSTGRFAEERRAFLCDLNERGHGFAHAPTGQQILAGYCGAGEHTATNADHGTCRSCGQPETGPRRHARRVAQTRRVRP